MKPLAVSGCGVVSALGIGREAFSKALSDPEAAIKQAFGRRTTVLDSETVGEARVAEVWDFDAKQHLGSKGLRNFDRLTKFLIVAAKNALEDAGIKRDGEYVELDPTRVGICSSTAYGSLDAITELNLVAELEDPRYINPARFPNTVINAAAGYVSIWEDLRAPNVTVVDGNCGSLDVVLTAETHLMHGRGDAFLVGGGEVLSEPLYLAFQKLGLIGTGHELGLGEGAAFVCLEAARALKARGGRALGYVVGYGTWFDPPESEAMIVNASSEAVARAVADALSDAGLQAKDVDVVCSAMGGLPLFADAEREGIKQALGESVAVAAPKRLYGETLGAAGALGMATALSWLGGVPVEPILHGRLPEQRAPRCVVVTTVGFYGNVSAVALVRPEANVV